MLNDQSQPLISVIMSVYNGEIYLKDAIESILNQTYKNIEFIIINDGSLDQSFEIIKRYKKIDSRIIIENNIENKGLIYSLNKGIDLSQGKYIARMDADDISEKNRLEEQVVFLEKNKDIAMCSTYIKIFKDNMKYLTKKFKTNTNYENIKIKLLFRNYIAHPTVMIRKDIIKKYNLMYNEKHKGMEDYGLWIKLVNIEKIVTLPKYLLKYRFLNSSITTTSLKKIDNYKKTLFLIFKEEFNKSFPNFSDKEISIHTEISMQNNLQNNFDFTLEDKLNYLIKLKEINYQQKKYQIDLFDKEILAKTIEVIVSQGNIKEVFKLSSRYKLNYYFIIKFFYLNMLKKELKKILR